MYAKTALDRPTLNACDSFGHLCCYLVSHGDPNAGSAKSWCITRYLDTPSFANQ